MKLRNWKFFGMVFLTLQTGCASMEAVQEYAAVTQATVGEVRPVAKDFYASCMRANSYKPFQFKKDCQNEEQASRAILLIGSVLGDYGSALGALSSDELVSYDKDIDGLTNEINNLGISSLDEDQVNAVGGLAKFIAKAATSGYQQSQVAKFIQESDEAVGKVSSTLSSIIQSNYTQALSIEISAWKEGYRRVEQETREKRALEWERHAIDQWKTRAELEDKKKAALTLADSIAQIGKTHSQLAKDSSQLTGKEVIALVKRYVKEAKPVIKEIQNTF